EGTGNHVTVTDWSGGVEGSSQSFVLGSAYPLPGPPTVTLASNGNPVETALAHNTGYFAHLGNLFGNVTKVIFTSHTDANVRLDNISATVIPLPAPMFLLLGGLGGLGLVARRRRTPAA